MARPKGSKDKGPRKPRAYDIDRRIKSRGANPEAPFGYSVHGEPLIRKRGPKETIPSTKEGKAALARLLEEKGLAKTKPKAGRPVKYVDPEQVKQMAMVGCTNEEMCSILGIALETLKSRFLALINEHRDKGKMSLRRLQLRIAQGTKAEWEVDPETKTPVMVRPGMPPSPQMAIHLGKHWLGQRDTAPTNNILVANGQAMAPGGPTAMSQETEDRLALLFLEICPEAAQGAVTLDRSMEVQAA